MPLHMSLFGDKCNSGHMFITTDGQIIFAWRFQKKNEESREIAFNYRKRIQSFFIKNSPLLAVLVDNEKETYAGTNDPRHLVLGHVSVYDQDLCIHAHWDLKEMNFNVLSLLFLPLLPHLDEVSDLFSKECLDSILEISKAYFLNLESSPNAKAIEEAYRLEKAEQLKIATIEAELQIKQKKAVKSNLMSSLFSGLATGSSSMTTSSSSMEDKEDEVIVMLKKLFVK